MEAKDKIQIVSIVVSILLVPTSAFVSTHYYRESIKEERAQSMIYQIYCENGIHKIESSVSTYGFTTILALSDMRRYVYWFIDDPDVLEKIEPKIASLRERKYVLELIDRDYGEATKYFSKLSTFSPALGASVKNTFYLYSKMLEDVTDYQHWRMQFENKSREYILEGTEGILAIAELLQRTEVYLELRLRQLSDFILTNNFKSFNDFFSLSEDDSYNKYILDIEEYTEKLGAFVDTIGTEQEMDTGQILYSWLEAHIPLNPFVDS